MLLLLEVYLRKHLPRSIVNYIKKWEFEAFQGVLDKTLPIMISNVISIEQVYYDSVLIRSSTGLSQLFNFNLKIVEFFDDFVNNTLQLKCWPNGQGIFVYSKKNESCPQFFVLDNHQLLELQHIFKTQPYKYITLSSGQLALVHGNKMQIWK